MFMLLLISCLTLLGLYLHKRLTYWRSKGVPQVSVIEYICLTVQQFFRSGHYIWKDVYERHKSKPIIGYYAGLNPAMIINDPEVIKDVLVKDFHSFDSRIFSVFKHEPLNDNMLMMTDGDQWKRQRVVLSNAFTAAKMRPITETLNLTSKNMIEALQRKANQNNVVDMEEFVSAYVMDSIAKLAFATNVNSQDDPNAPFIQNAKGLFNSTLSFFLLSLSPWLHYKLGMSIMNKEKTAYFSELLKSIIKTRSEGNGEYHDIAGTLQEATKRKELNETEFMSNALMLFAAASETSMSAMHWAIYHLAMTPEAFQTLKKEVEEHIGTKTEFDYDDLANLTYAEACLKETVRLGATDPIILRTNRVPAMLNGIKIEPHTEILIPAAGIHKNKAYFEDPETFKPERFLPENRSSLHPFTFLGFGDGPRHCVGIRLATTLFKMFLVRMVQSFDIEKCKETPEEYELQPVPFVKISKQPLFVRLVPKSTL